MKKVTTKAIPMTLGEMNDIIKAVKVFGKVKTEAVFSAREDMKVLYLKVYKHFDREEKRLLSKYCKQVGMPIGLKSDTCGLIVTKLG